MSAPPKLGSMKYSCAICQVAHSRGCVRASRVLRACVLDRCGSAVIVRLCRSGCLQRSWPHVEPLREREAGFVHVGGDVGGIEKEHVAGLRADSADIAIGQLGLDDMAQLAMPEWKLEVALQRGRPDVDPMPQGLCG